MPWKDPAVARARRRARYHANIEARRARNRRDSVLFRQRHPDKIKAQNDSYRARHLESERARSRLAMRRRRANPLWRLPYTIHMRIYLRAYKLAHPEKVHAYSKTGNAQRRARKAAAKRNTLSTAQWHEILAVFHHRCAYCGRKSRKLEPDHITPVVDKGDSHEHNIVPACRACNATKSAGPPLSPVQPLLLTVARPKQPRLTPPEAPRTPGQ